MKYRHEGLSYTNPEIDCRRGWSQDVRGSEGDARARMMKKQGSDRKRIERDAERRKAEKDFIAAEVERRRLDEWAKNTRLYSSYSDYEDKKRRGRMGYAD